MVKSKTFLWHTKQEGKATRRHTFAGLLENGTLRVAVATCNPHEDFTRSRGREIAIGRLNKGKDIYSTQIADTLNTKEFMQIIEQQVYPRLNTIA